MKAKAHLPLLVRQAVVAVQQARQPHIMVLQDLPLEQLELVVAKELSQ